MGELINYTSGVSVMMTTFGLIKHLGNIKEMDTCSRRNIQAGLAFGFVSGAIVVRNAFRS
jgi:hypothetical protein